MIAARRLWTAAVVLVLAATALLGGASIASLADTPGPHLIRIALPDKGIGFTASPRASLIDDVRIAPGVAATGRLGVRNVSGGPADLYLKVVGLREDDRCDAASRPAATPCTPGALGRLLTLRLFAAPRRHAHYAHVWTGTAQDLSHGVQLGSDVPDHAARWYRLSARLPRSAGNATESELLHFGFQVGLDGAARRSSAVLLGNSARSDSHRSVLGLAITGTRVTALAALAGTLLVSGALMSFLGRRRDRRAGRRGPAESRLSQPI